MRRRHLDGDSWSDQRPVCSFATLGHAPAEPYAALDVLENAGEADLRPPPVRGRRAARGHGVPHPPHRPRPRQHKLG
jgi:hypothetical protein